MILMVSRAGPGAWRISLKSPFDTTWRGVDVAGSVALAFVNTLDWRGREEPVELLARYEDLLHWAHDAGAIDAGDARALLAWRAAHPRRAELTLAGAIEVREAIAAVFQAVARRRPIPAGPLARIGEGCRDAWRSRVLDARGRAGAAWAWREPAPEPERPVWAAALDAERLLIGGGAERVRECGDPQCAWLFLDTSRNRSRRWCAMEACGNRSKARRFRTRAARRA